MARNTVNRGTLRRHIAKGMYEIKCNYHLTDDYAFDAANKNGKTDWMPAEDAGLTDWHFQTKSGGAYKNADGTISFYVHSNLNYTLRLKQN